MTTDSTHLTDSDSVAGRWPVPPPDGYTVDDLFTLPDLPPHTQLIDGSLVFRSAQRPAHAAAVELLFAGLRRTMPPDLRVRQELAVVLDRRNGHEPDVTVVRTEALTTKWQSHVAAADVLLAVEVVSPDSEARDRDTKPHKYAAAGIPHFWLVETAGPGAHPVVEVYERGHATGAYMLTGIHRDRLSLKVPYAVEIDIA
ncbi:protein of unknown function DUF820 [Actinobacteria bacterium OK074]|nr:protein of unknown function DUF820 [Actinobacteria bacterium OK074]